MSKGEGGDRKGEEGGGSYVARSPAGAVMGRGNTHLAALTSNVRRYYGDLTRDGHPEDDPLEKKAGGGEGGGGGGGRESRSKGRGGGTCLDFLHDLFVLEGDALLQQMAAEVLESSQGRSVWIYQLC